MARAPELSRQAAAFLDMIAWCEGTSTHSLTRDDGYDVIVTGVDGKEIFTDYSAHPFEAGRPAKKINSRGLYSTASGRYQDLLRIWSRYGGMLNLPDFSPVNQDRANWYMIKERKADVLIEEGMIEDAIKLVANIWASLPGRGYPGQGQRTMTQCLAAFENCGGHIQWNSSLSSVASADGSLPSLREWERSSPSWPNPSETDDGKPRPNPLSELFKQIAQLWSNNRRS